MIYAFRKNSKRVTFVEAEDSEEAIEILSEMEIECDEDDLVEIDGPFVATFKDGALDPDMSTVDDIAIDELEMKWKVESDDEDDE